ncbi:MAG: hypothetical protein IJW62_06400 [Clostridia bacterium]|nr:hypothetical protein [Clostridia bacterium]
MKAVFKTYYKFLPIVFLILAIIWSGLCVFMFARGKIAGVGDAVACSSITVIACFFSMIPFLYNYKAYLHLNNQKIIGRFGFFKRLECDIADVTFVLAQLDSIYILLKDRKYCIRGIHNAHAIYAYITQRMPFSPCDVTKSLVKKIKKRSANQKKNVILVFCMIGLSFAWVFITMLLTGARDLPEFSRVDWIIFGVMWILEIPTVIAMFVFAIRSGKRNLQLERQMYEVKRSVLEKTPLSLGPGCVQAVWVDFGFSQRITVYSGCVENDPLSACYNVEIFDDNYMLHFLYQSEICTGKELTELFDGYLNITDSFTHTTV